MAVTSSSSAEDDAQTAAEVARLIAQCEHEASSLGREYAEQIKEQAVKIAERWSNPPADANRQLEKHLEEGVTGDKFQELQEVLQKTESETLEMLRLFDRDWFEHMCQENPTDDELYQQVLELRSQPWYPVAKEVVPEAAFMVDWFEQLRKSFMP